MHPAAGFCFYDTISKGSSRNKPKFVTIRKNQTIIRSEIRGRAARHSQAGFRGPSGSRGRVRTQIKLAVLNVSRRGLAFGLFYSQGASCSMRFASRNRSCSVGRLPRQYCQISRSGRKPFESSSSTLLARSAQISVPRQTRNLAVGNSLRERSGSCDQIFRGSGARAAVSLPYPREFGSLPLGRLSRASSFSSAPIACSIVNPEGHS